VETDHFDGPELGSGTSVTSPPCALSILDPLLADPDYPRLKQRLVASTGLAYYTDKDADLARRVGRRLDSLNLRDCASYLKILQDPVGGASELDALIAEITIGETYFFRHQEHFDALRDIVLPALIARNQLTGRLRVWSAGCADGAEPYSVSILMRRQLRNALAGWSLTVLGTDINRHALSRARDGVFADWSLRAISDELRGACFSPEDKQWRIAPEYKADVSFQYHNLIENSFPSLVNNLSSFDLIVCRNVMIYFSLDVMGELIQKFHECLVPGGWLLVGPSEPNMTHFTSFRTVNAPGVTLYQKPFEQPARTAEALCAISEDLGRKAGAELQESARVETPKLLPDGLGSAGLHRLKPVPPSCPTQLHENVETPAPHPSLLFRQALTLGEMSRQEEAERYARQAIYLDPGFALAHYYLGLLLQSHRDSRRAARSFQNAIEAVETRPCQEALTDGGGITAGELKNLAQMQLATLGDVR
jgi:chemotaxis protein methyltransferase CheR